MTTLTVLPKAIKLADALTKANTAILERKSADYFAARDEVENVGVKLARGAFIRRISSSPQLITELKTTTTEDQFAEIVQDLSYDTLMC